MLAGAVTAPRGPGRKTGTPGVSSGQRRRPRLRARPFVLAAGRHEAHAVALVLEQLAKGRPAAVLALVLARGERGEDDDLRDDRARVRFPDPPAAAAVLKLEE